MARILVVDDEPGYRHLLEVNLKAEGYEIICAGNGLVALEMVVNQHPDLIILDIMMPILDGISTCERIRQISNVSVIFLTALYEESDRVDGLNMGADDYIIKPFSASELIARVRAVLRRAPTSEHKLPNQFFIQGNLKIDFTRAEVWVNDKTVNLSSTEYKLLIQFATHIGQILTPETLLVAVWGPQYNEDKEILWVSIARLRQKLEDKAASPKHIITKSGMGYFMPLHQ